jgi:hypothetical protein
LQNHCQILALAVAGQEICCYGKRALIITTTNDGSKKTISPTFFVAEIVLFTKLSEKARNK